MKEHLLGAVLVSAVMALGVSSAQSAPIPPGSWLTQPAVAALLEGKEGYCLGFSSALVSGIKQDRVYMTHGFQPGPGDTNHTRAYDIDTDTWIALAGAPTSRSEGVGLEKGGLVYCIGGRLAGVVATVEAYNPTTDSWTTLTPMGTARAGLAAANVSDFIYTFGGNAVGIGPCSGPALAVAEVYDILADTWSPITPPPIAVTQATAVAKGGKIYLIGGCDNLGAPTADDHVQIYDPNTDTWAAGPPMPTPRAALALGVLGKVIYAIGGTDFAPGNLSVVEAFDTAAGAWFAGALTAKPVAASEIFAASHGNRLYVPGSGSFGIGSAVHEVFIKK